MWTVVVWMVVLSYSNYRAFASIGISLRAGRTLLEEYPRASCAGYTGRTTSNIFTSSCITQYDQYTHLGCCVVLDTVTICIYSWNDEMTCGFPNLAFCCEPLHYPASLTDSGPIYFMYALGRPPTPQSPGNLISSAASPAPLMESTLPRASCDVYTGRMTTNIFTSRCIALFVGYTHLGCCIKIENVVICIYSWEDMMVCGSPNLALCCKPLHYPAANASVADSGPVYFIRAIGSPPTPQSPGNIIPPAASPAPLIYGPTLQPFSPGSPRTPRSPDSPIHPAASPAPLVDGPTLQPSSLVNAASPQGLPDDHGRITRIIVAVTVIITVFLVILAVYLIVHSCRKLRLLEQRRISPAGTELQNRSPTETASAAAAGAS